MSVAIKMEVKTVTAEQGGNFLGRVTRATGVITVTLTATLTLGGFGDIDNFNVVIIYGVNIEYASYKFGG